MKYIPVPPAPEELEKIAVSPAFNIGLFVPISSLCDNCINPEVPLVPITETLPVTCKILPSNVKFCSASPSSTFEATVIKRSSTALFRLSNPELPEEPALADEPLEPELPDDPELPDEPEDPELPDELELPEDPLEPELPDDPELPDEPDDPELPDEPELPLEPEVPSSPPAPTRLTSQCSVALPQYVVVLPEVVFIFMVNLFGLLV